jgi:glycosyltransferase involved in cell wall biosynthesis
MKILQVMAGAQHGGAETAFVDMCLALHEAGESIEVVTRGNDVRVPPLKEAGIKVHTLPFGGAVDVFTPWRMTKIIKEFQPDIVQTWMARGSVKTPAWKKSMGVPQYKVVARLGGYYKIKYFKNADYFVTITPDIKKYLEQNDIAPERVRHINNFAETENIVTPINRTDHDTPPDAPLLLGLGRLHASKAFDTLIKAVAVLPGVYLWIAGEGPQRKELEKLIDMLRVQDRVKLLGWRSDRAALFQAADICVFSSRYEPFGTVFVQAWAQKTPLITTDADGPRQFVRHGEDGLMVKVDDQGALSESIKTLIENKNLQKTLVENGFRRYQGEFTKEEALRQYLAYYHEIRR